MSADVKYACGASVAEAKEELDESVHTFIRWL
jgi:hypothetical protein